MEKIKNIVETQQRNEERAVFGRGPYRVRKEFEHLTVDDKKRSQLNHEQLMKKVVEFKKASMNDMRDILCPVELETQESVSPVQQLGLNITAKESGISTIPMTILESIFERASNLISTTGSVIPKLGADDGSFIVAGTCNKIHYVTPGKGGCLSCDRSCVNVSTMICEHVLAVVQKKEMLNEFITRFNKRRKRVSMMDMVEQGGPKTVGKKPSGRKRTNAKTKTVERCVNLFTNKESFTASASTQRPSVHPSQSISAFPSRPQMPSTQHHSFHPSQSMPVFPSRPQMPSTQHHNVHPLQSISAFPLAPQMPSTQHHSVHPSQSISALPLAPQMPSTHQPSVYSPSAMSAMWTLSVPSTHAAAMQGSASQSYVGHYSSMANPSSHSRAFQTTPTSSTASQVAGVPSSFGLKWVEGTKVSKCYGCGGIIKNPPENTQRQIDWAVTTKQLCPKRPFSSATGMPCDKISCISCWSLTHNPSISSGALS